MDFGIAFPPVPGADGRTIIDWARAGEEAGFATLATLDRIVWGCYEGLVTLAAAAAVTSRCRLMTAVMVAPLRSNTALLAKQAASVDQLSEGRLTLGLAAGIRPDDFAASGVDPGTRGAALSEQIADMRRIWAGEPRGIAGRIGPPPAQSYGPPIVIGGVSDPAIARAARLGSGWISGGGGPGMFRAGAAAFRAAWSAEGRSGQPRLYSLLYYALGDSAAADAQRYISDYYAFAPPYAQFVLAGAAVGEDQVADRVSEYQQAGCDELIFVPCTADLAQIKLLHNAVH